jgi:hypothetical protein
MEYFCVPISIEKTSYKRNPTIIGCCIKSKGIKSPYYSFLLKECKGMHKLIQLISNFLYKKKHVSFYATTCSLCKFDGKNHMKISKFSNFEIKGYKGNDYFIK